VSWVLCKNERWGEGAIASVIIYSYTQGLGGNAQRRRLAVQGVVGKTQTRKGKTGGMAYVVTAWAPPLAWVEMGRTAGGGEQQHDGRRFIIGKSNKLRGPPAAPGHVFRPHGGKRSLATPQKENPEGGIKGSNSISGGGTRPQNPSDDSL